MILASFGIHRVPYATNRFDLECCETFAQSKRKKNWKNDLIYPHFILCCCTDKQTQIETERIFSSNFRPFIRFNATIKEASKPSVNTQRQLSLFFKGIKFFFFLVVIKPNILHYLRTQFLVRQIYIL